MKRNLIVAGAIVLAACSEPTVPSQRSASDLHPAASLAAGNNTVVVTEADVARQTEDTPPTRSWVVYTRPGTATGAFVISPDAPPLGVGGFETSTPDASAKVWLFNYDHVGTALSSITGLSYSTYKSVGATSPAFPSINIEVDIDGGSLGVGEFRTFVYEPYVNAGFVNSTGLWETRDAYAAGAGRWWTTTGGTAGVATGGARGCGQATPCTWGTLLAAFPGATIVGGFGINQGSGNPGIVATSDALRIAYGGNSLTYDFEPYATATSKELCKDGGWTVVKRADGSSFTNQGDCVSYVNNGK